MKRFLKISIFIIGIGLLVASCSKQNNINEYLNQAPVKMYQ
jgi:hypothetical protein